MAGPMRIVLEIGTKGRRVVAGAVDWPGLDRWGGTEDDALDKLAAYVPRYMPVATRARLGRELGTPPALEVVERYPGSSSTDFWGIAHVPSTTEAAPLSRNELGRRLRLLRACWATFDEVAHRVTDELRPGPRGGGRSRDEIVRHVYASERLNWSPKVEVRTGPDILTTPDGLVAHRLAFTEAIRAYHADGRMARKWPLAFLIRRTAQHVMDHAWEMEDRDLA